MAISDVFDPNTLIGAPVHSTDGEKLGRIESIYYDNETNRPAWAATRTGLFGGHVSLVPLGHGDWDGSTLTVPFDKAALKNAPHHDPDPAISSTDEGELYRHYGINTTGSGQQVGTAAAVRHGEHSEDAGRDPRRDRAGEPGIEGRDLSGPTTDDAMTRSEEQLRVGTQQVESGRARLRKFVVTENVSTTVPVSREEVTIEREPITDANRAEATSGADLPRRSTRSPSPSSGSWWTRRPSRSSGSAWVPRPSPSSSTSTRPSARSRSRPTASSRAPVDGRRTDRGAAPAVQIL